LDCFVITKLNSRNLFSYSNIAVKLTYCIAELAIFIRESGVGSEEEKGWEYPSMEEEGENSNDEGRV